MVDAGPIFADPSAWLYIIILQFNTKTQSNIIITSKLFFGTILIKFIKLIQVITRGLLVLDIDGEGAEGRFAAELNKEEDTVSKDDIGTKPGCNYCVLTNFVLHIEHCCLEIVQYSDFTNLCWTPRG